MKIRSVILAAGKGTRMESPLPKVLHLLDNRPMVQYAVETGWEVTGRKPVLVVGYGADQVQEAVGSAADYVHQEKQLGTGHAVQQAEELLKGQADFVLVTSADMPLLKGETLWKLIDIQQKQAGPMTMLTVVYEDPRGFGRVIRGEDGLVQMIVEEVVANPEQLAVRELNAGAYCFRADWLWNALSKIKISPKGEYFLTDLVEIAVREGGAVQAYTTNDPAEVIGINTRAHLKEAESLLARRTRADQG